MHTVTIRFKIQTDDAYDELMSILDQANGDGSPIEYRILENSETE